MNDHSNCPLGPCVMCGVVLTEHESCIHFSPPDGPWRAYPLHEVCYEKYVRNSPQVLLRRVTAGSSGVTH